MASAADTYAESLGRALQHLRKAKNVVVLSGAGMSTAAGIPDFRSPGGLYGNAATLLDRFTWLDSSPKGADWQKQQLTQSVRTALEYGFFKHNPVSYHEMRRGLIIGLGVGQWKLTLGHLFPEILNQNSKLRLLASQNIDGLDHKVVSDKSKLYNPHGLMSTLVSEPEHEFLCRDIDHPIYQRYVELVKSCVKDIYDDLPPREGKSSHLWPGPQESTPITLEMFGDLLPDQFHGRRDQEKAGKGYAVKPGSVLFDGMLWQENAAGEKCNGFEDVRSCDLMLVMGTSLSGLTIDQMAYGAARQGTPLVVFDMSTAPVESITQQGSWKAERDCFLQSPIDESILKLAHGIGWLDQILDFLPHLCLGSLRTTKEFYDQNISGAEAQLARIDEAIEAEVEREKHFYAED